MQDAAALCGRHEIPAIGLWRDRVAEAGLSSAVAAVRDAGLHVSSLCRGGFFTHADPEARAAAMADNRAALTEAAELGADGVGAFLVWGDPSLYDSTLRIIDRLLARGAVAFEYTVIPGVTSAAALAAAHRVPLNRVGEPVFITPARRIAGGLPEGLDSAVVMLDPGFTAAGFDDPALTVFWGAYLSTADETLISGPLAEVADQITATRAELRARHGWIMDTYLLRRD